MSISIILKIDSVKTRYISSFLLAWLLFIYMLDLCYLPRILIKNSPLLGSTLVLQRAHQFIRSNFSFICYLIQWKQQQHSLLFHRFKCNTNTTPTFTSTTTKAPRRFRTRSNWTATGKSWSLKCWSPIGLTWRISNLFCS